eukprot:364198-Chlamydomonas_euryale.AAC.24
MMYGLPALCILTVVPRPRSLVPGVRQQWVWAELCGQSCESRSTHTPHARPTMQTRGALQHAGVAAGAPHPGVRTWDQMNRVLSCMELQAFLVWSCRGVSCVELKGFLCGAAGFRAYGDRTEVDPTANVKTNFHFYAYVCTQSTLMPALTPLQRPLMPLSLSLPPLPPPL